MAKATKDHTEEFLSEFKRVEQIIQQVYGSDKTFRDIELLMDEKGQTETSKKMQICRNIRNYATHNPDSHLLIPVPEEMVLYLQKLYIEFSSEIEKVKNTMSRTKAMTKADDITYGAQRLAKIAAVPVVDDDGMLLGAFDTEVLRKCIADGVTLKTKVLKDTVKLAAIPAYACVTQSTPMRDVIEIFNNQKLSIMYVTDTGKPKGKYIGTVVNTFE